MKQENKERPFQMTRIREREREKASILYGQVLQRKRMEIRIRTRKELKRWIETFDL